MTRINYESVIPVSSTIIGRTIREVEKKFSGIKISHYHNVPGDLSFKGIPNSKIVLRAGWLIKIRNAPQKKLAKFCEYYGLP